jgi:hypothetical protein
MGQVRQDNVQIKLEIDGSQSKTELDNLTRKAQLLQTGLKEMKRGTDEYIAANKELREVNTRMTELRNDIGITGLSLNQLGKLSKQLSRELQDLTPGTEAFIAKTKEFQEVDGRLTGLRREIRGVQDDLDNAGGGVGDFIKKAIGFAGIQLGVEAVVSGLKELGTESIAEFEQAQNAAAQLEATLNSTGNAAGLTKDKLLDLSTALEGKTIFDGDAITQAQSVLLTFTKIKKGVYEEAVPAITDMATKLAGDGPADLKGATIQVGKALNDPIKGISALGKAGVSFSEDQKTMIKSLVETGDVAAAQTIILNELKTEFGGSAEAAAKAGTGPFKQFEVQIGNVKEGLGELIIDGLTALQPVLAGGLKLFAFFIELLKATPAFINENKGVLLGLGFAILTLNAANIAASASTLYFAAVEKGRAIAPTASATAQRLLNAAMTANPIGLVIAAVALLVGGLVTLYERSEKVREVFAGLLAASKQVFSSIKDIVVNELGSVATLLAGIFTFNPVLIAKALDTLGPALRKAGTNVASAYHSGYNAQEKEEQAAQAARDKQAQAAQAQRAKEAAAKVAADTTAANLEALKNREANIKAALALVAAGSAEELRLKKLEVATKRDIDLLDEKKTAGDKKVIRAEALRDLRQLQDDYDKKTKDAAEKRAKEQADVEKKIADLKAGLLADETERKVQQLIAAADKEKATARGTAEQIAEQRRLIMDKLAVDIAAVRQAQALKQQEEELDIEKRTNALIKNEFDRRAADLQTAAKAEKLKILETDAQGAEKRRLIEAKLQQDLVQLGLDRAEREREIAERILAIDEDIALRRLARRRQFSNEWSQQRAQADAEEQAVRKAQLEAQFAQEYFQEGLNVEQKLAITRKYLQDKEDLENEYADRSRERDKAGMEFGLEQTANVLSIVADFEKISSDKQLAKLDKDKKSRLAKIDAEYKAGTISKESYEAQKANIEQDYDAKTRQVKKQAAEKEKEFNIAQAVIAGALAVIKASPNVPLMIAAGVTAAAGVAKIVATPIPEFEKGGIVGGAKPTWREKVRQFASGGRINSRAGVADVGQRHSGGGIRMVDGATGEHLGEWERGEAYMILSRDTYANNKHLVDELIDTSLYRGGAPVRRQPGYFADGGTFATSPGAPSGASASGTGQELVQAVLETRDAVRALPGRIQAFIVWGQDDTASIEDALSERAADRAQGEVR